jgi:hypothetical protein
MRLRESRLPLPYLLSGLGIRNLFSAFLSSGSAVAAVSLRVTTSRAAVTEHCGEELDASTRRRSSFLTCLEPESLYKQS